MFQVFVLLLCATSILATPLDVVKPVPVKDAGGRIVNGDDAKDGQFPWQVAVLGSSPAIPSYLCGGALISDQWVLTAGHCVEGATRATIYSGSATFASPNRTSSQASDFILHERYDPSYLTNDIGLIKLSRPVTLNEFTQPIALSDDELRPDTHVTVSGWGSISDTDPNPYNPVLEYITVSTILNIECQAIYGSDFVADGVVCTSTGSPVKSPCLGDSGGPVVANFGGKKPVHVAVFSFVNGLGCEYPYPAGNTRTAYYRDWIKEKTGI